MTAKISLDDAPGIIYESVYYFEKLSLKRGFFTVGVYANQIVRVDRRKRALLGRSIDAVIRDFESKKYVVHKI